MQYQHRCDKGVRKSTSNCIIDRVNTLLNLFCETIHTLFLTKGVTDSHTYLQIQSIYLSSSEETNNFVLTIIGVKSLGIQTSRSYTLFVCIYTHTYRHARTLAHSPIRIYIHSTPLSMVCAKSTFIAVIIYIQNQNFIHRHLLACLKVY